MSGTDEQAAIAQLKRGEIAGLSLLVMRYEDQAVRAAYLVCHDLAVAEDVVQDAFLRAYEKIAQFDQSRPFAPWFLRSVVNAALRAATRQSRQVDDTDDRLAASISHDPQPDDLLAAAETKEAVWAALDRLSLQQRAAVVLRYYLDLSEAEMAAQLAVPPGTVERRLHDARLRLRQLLPAWLQPTVKE